jgi:hypothetical protein
VFCGDNMILLVVWVSAQVSLVLFPPGIRENPDTKIGIHPPSWNRGFRGNFQEILFFKSFLSLIINKLCFYEKKPAKNHNNLRAIK